MRSIPNGTTPSRPESRPEALIVGRRLSVADPSAVIRSMTCAGGTNCAIDGCGMSTGGINGAAEMVGLVYFADMFLPRPPLKAGSTFPELWPRFLLPLWRSCNRQLDRCCRNDSPQDLSAARCRVSIAAILYVIVELVGLQSGSTMLSRGNPF
jgi:hypothetical protein